MNIFAFESVVQIKTTRIKRGTQIDDMSLYKMAWYEII